MLESDAARATQSPDALPAVDCAAGDEKELRRRMRNVERTLAEMATVMEALAQESGRLRADVHVMQQEAVTSAASTQQSLLVRFEISSVRYSFGFSETPSGHCVGRKCNRNTRPIVRNVRKD